jgi:hypothetical protein
MLQLMHALQSSLIYQRLVSAVLSRPAHAPLSDILLFVHRMHAACICKLRGVCILLVTHWFAVAAAVPACQLASRTVAAHDLLPGCSNFSEGIDLFDSIMLYDRLGWHAPSSAPALQHVRCGGIHALVVPGS